MGTEFILSWYFAIWGMSGSLFVTVGPFHSEVICQAARAAIVTEVGTANQVSQCWPSQSTIPGAIP